MGEDYPYEAKRQIVSLIQTLDTLTKRDPEQEVQGIALPVLDAVIESIREALPDNAVVAAVRGVLSPEQIASGEPIRAADALLVATQLSLDPPKRTRTLSCLHRSAALCRPQDAAPRRCTAPAA